MPIVRSLLSAALLGVAVLSFSACNAGKTGGTVLSLEPAADPAFVDVPVPLGFTKVWDPLNSQSHNSSRAAYVRYRGGSDFLSVARFYADFLPPQKWKLQSQQFGVGAAYLRYAKGDETLLVSIFAKQTTTDITLKMGPTLDIVGVVAPPVSQP